MTEMASGRRPKDDDRSASLALNVSMPAGGLQPHTGRAARNRVGPGRKQARTDSDQAALTDDVFDPELVFSSPLKIAA